MTLFRLQTQMKATEARRTMAILLLFPECGLNRSNHSNSCNRNSNKPSALLHRQIPPLSKLHLNLLRSNSWESLNSKDNNSSLSWSPSNFRSTSTSHNNTFSLS